MPDVKGKGGDSKHGGSRKADQGKPLSNPHVTKFKRERRDTETSDDITGVKGGKTQSVRSGSTHKKNILLENTYKLTPDEDHMFSSPKVRNVAQEVMESILKEAVCDDPKTNARLCKEIVEKVKEKVKDLSMPRHKIVVHAVVGGRGEQSMKVASRCLWNHNYDSHTTAEYENKHIFGLVTVYGIYFE